MLFTIEGRLPGLNDMIDAARSHWAASSTQKKKWTKACAVAAIAGGITPISCPVTIDITWFEPDGRRDIDNVAAGTKFILDGLVLANRLPNDDRKWIRDIVHRFPTPDKFNPRIEVRIRPATADMPLFTESLERMTP